MLGLTDQSARVPSMSPKDELANRRRRFQAHCRLCRWGWVPACDRALAFPHLNFDDRNRLLRLRAQTSYRRRVGLYGLAFGVAVVALVAVT